MRTCTAGMADSSLVMPDTPAAAFFDLDRTPAALLAPGDTVRFTVADRGREGS